MWLFDYFCLVKNILTILFGIGKKIVSIHILCPLGFSQTKHVRANSDNEDIPDFQWLSKLLLPPGPR